MKCPQCKSEDVMRSKRRGIERLFKHVAPLAPYRCKECWNRFWSYRNPLDTLASKLIAVVIILVFAAPPAYYQLQKIDWEFGEQIVHKKIDADPVILNSAVGSPPDIARFFPEKNLKMTDSIASLMQTVSEEVETSAMPWLSPSEPADTVFSIEPLSVPEEPAATDSEPEIQSSAVNSHQTDLQEESRTTTEDAAQENKSGSSDDLKTPDRKQTFVRMPDQTEKRTVTAIRAEDADNGTRISILTNRQVGNYKYFSFTENGILKVVIDLNGKWISNVRHDIAVDSDLIKRIRTGKHKDKVRVVADLKVKKMLPPVVSSSDEGIVVMLKKDDDQQQQMTAE